MVAVVMEQSIKKFRDGTRIVEELPDGPQEQVMIALIGKIGNLGWEPGKEVPAVLVGTDVFLKTQGGDTYAHWGRLYNRKPYNRDAGYIASRKSGANNGWIVIYNAKEQGIDDTDGKYAVVCQSHKQIVNCTSIPKARAAMKYPDFCSECRKELS